MNENQMERLVIAFENIATSLEGLHNVAQAEFSKKYAVKVWKEAKIGHIKTEEELLRESQGDTGEPLEEWLGPREKELAKDRS
jgi:hypothetical protein